MTSLKDSPIKYTNYLLKRSCHLAFDYPTIMEPSTSFSQPQESSEERSRQGESKLSFRTIVKGIHECDFDISVGDEFNIYRKVGNRGRAFVVLNDNGRLGHIQKELVSILWKLDANVQLKG